MVYLEGKKRSWTKKYLLCRCHLSSKGATLTFCFRVFEGSDWKRLISSFTQTLYKILYSWFSNLNMKAIKIFDETTPKCQCPIAKIGKSVLGSIQFVAGHLKDRRTNVFLRNVGWRAVRAILLANLRHGREPDSIWNHFLDTWYRYDRMFWHVASQK